MIEILTGILLGMTSTQLLYVAWAHMELKSKKTEMTEKLHESLQLISESHNALVESVKTLDKKVNETVLRVDVALTRKQSVSHLSNATSPFSKPGV